MREINSRRFTFQLFLLLIFWSIYVFTFTVQMYNLPTAQPGVNIPQPDPWTFHPWEYNPFNDRMTLIESWAIWLGAFYGMLRIFNILRIISEDEEETRWEKFWELNE